MQLSKKFSIAAVLAGLVSAGMGCELIVAPDRSLINDGGAGGVPGTGGGGAPGTGGTGGTGGSGGCVPEDDMLDCTEDVCNPAGGTDHNPVDLGDPCDDNSGNVCNATGICVECNVPADCGDPMFTCDTETCVPVTCTDGVINGDETDVDCGGSCLDNCADGEGCLVGDDCESKICDAGTMTCTARVCGDSFVNGTEECDDGNTNAGDGCDDLCALETGWDCTPDDPTVCTDINECMDGTDNCDTNATCMNNDGSFTCMCNMGYMGDGVTCANIDECAMGTDNCDTNATCADNDGSFTCTCNMGYSGDGVTCTNIDECAMGTDNCDTNATCTDNDGSFSCACNMGYTGDGVTCTNIDECMLGTDNCDTNATCTDTPGLFTCACNMGYTGDGVTCTNIDECMLGTDNCDANATCTDTPGSFTCACNMGYTGNGVTCTNINECMDNTDNCDANATCADTPGSFTCTCNMGFMGSGVTCTPICGDGLKLGTEACDDANVTPKDGCSATCTVDPGYTCTGQGAGSCLIEVNCSDGLDDDGDGQIDLADSNCALGTTFTCAAGETLLVRTTLDVPQNIPDNNTTGITATAGFTTALAVKKVVMRMTLPHEFDADVDVTLNHGATTVDVTSDNGGSGVNYTNTIFNDSAATNITVGTAPFTGTFQPEQAFTAFGGGAGGIWNLVAKDDAGGDVGSLTAWELALCVHPCGNGTPDAGEACDDGNSVNGDGCDNNCTVSACNNGIIAPNENCEDGNTTASDGCSATCLVEPGFTCTGAVPQTCTNTCGNGNLSGNEQCDDGGTMGTDGCSSTCQVEPGYQCTSASPSVCTEQEQNCSDAVDNDSDGSIDGADSDCQIPAYVPACTGGATLRVYKTKDAVGTIVDNTPAGTTQYVTIPDTITVARLAILYNITHTFDGDVDITLTGPGNLPSVGASLDVCSDNGSSGDNFTNTVLDTTCATAVTAGTAPFSGCFQPETTFATFNTTSAKGKWALRAVDDAAGAAGTLDNWAVIVCAAP